MNYHETIDFLFSRLPMFHRIGAAAYRANLDNILAISDITGNPQQYFKSVHIAGTNGKGSVSNMLASVFMESGYKTGLFTSPHLKDFRERVRINGEMIPENEVIRFVENYRSIFEHVNPSFFEWTTALAFQHFADEKVDVAIIETGLGGRLDSTNIITPELSIVTNISYDHMNLLGDTLEKIAVEKAGIIKNAIPVVIGEREKETENVFIRKADEMKTELTFASDQYKAKEISSVQDGMIIELIKNNSDFHQKVKLSLPGIYQLKNICTVAAAYEQLVKSFPKLEMKHFIEGVRKVQENTGLRGRWEILSDSPLTIADIGHNEAGIRAVVNQLEQISNNGERKIHIVFGMVTDKDVTHILELLPKYATYYFCKADLPRAMEASELQLKAKEVGLEGRNFPSVRDALEAARQHAKVSDIIFIGGSTFVVAEAI